MIEKLAKYLNEPYPYFYRNQLRLLVLLLILSVLSFLFSYSFDPFVVNVDEHKMSYIWILIIHAFLPLPIAYGYFFGLNYVVKNDSHWTLGKELLHLCVILILIGIGSFLIRDFIYNNPDNWSFRYLYEEIRNTFLVSALLLLILLPLNLERLIKKHSKSSEKLTFQASTENSKQHIIQVSSGNENVQLDVQQFLFAKVESNYTEIYSENESQLDKIIVRITLKELEILLQEFPNIFKTHRSYLVNLDKITACKGNAQGYQLSLQNYSETVPVSRSKLKTFDAYF